MPTNLTPASHYLEPWSIVSDSELRLLRELREVCDVLRYRDDDITLYMSGVAPGPFKMGRAAEIVRMLARIGR